MTLIPKLIINNNNLINSKKKKGKSSKLTKKRRVVKKPEICSPHLNTSKTNHSCFSKSALLNIVQAWNKSHPDNKIKIKKSDNHNKIWSKLGDKMSDKCGNEYCWTKQPFFKETITKRKINLKKTFRPSRPKSWKSKPREWLDTYNILDVMEQYELAHPDYKFFGPVPIDFDLKDKFDKCVVSELCSINIEELYNKGIRKLGIIFNLDKHNQPGSHWIAMYMDLKKNIIGYWDSYGYKPPEEVVRLMNKLKQQSIDKLSIKCEIKINKTQHQFKNSECGVYSMHFIVKQLEGSSFEKVTKKIIKDDKMFLKRKKFFNHM